MSRLQAVLSSLPKLASDVVRGVADGPAGVTTEERVRAYYDACHHHYQLIWFDAESAAMHYGYHDAQVRTRTEALSRLNEVLADLAAIGPGTRVLDAGCGVGGSSVWLAKRRGATTTGVSIVASHVEAARARAEVAGVAERASFEIADFGALPFADNSFDVFWAVESLCHADDKALVLREAARVLRPGGQLVVADGFAAQPGLAPPRLRTWLSGWAVPHLATLDSFESGLLDAGFERVRSRDVTPRVLPSARAMAGVAWLCTPATALLASTGRMSDVQVANVRSARLQYPSLRSEEWRYCLVVATNQAGAADNSKDAAPTTRRP